MCRKAARPRSQAVASISLWFNVDFTRTEFIDSYLVNANFNGATLSFADIIDSNFSNTTFLTDTNIQTNIQTETNLNDITISKSDFTDAQFGDGVSATTMRRAIVHGGTFDGTDFRNVDLTRTEFIDSYLGKSQLQWRNAFLCGHHRFKLFEYNVPDRHQHSDQHSDRDQPQRHHDFESRTLPTHSSDTT